MAISKWRTSWRRPDWLPRPSLDPSATPTAMPRRRRSLRARQGPKALPAEPVHPADQTEAGLPGLRATPCPRLPLLCRGQAAGSGSGKTGLSVPPPSLAAGVIPRRLTARVCAPSHQR